MIRSLIVDDEFDGRQSIRNMLQKYCHQVEVIDEATGVEDAYLKITELRPQLVFLDIRMDDGTAFDLLQKFREISFHIIFVTAYDEYALEAIRYSAIDYLLKPARPTLLIEAIEKVTKQSRLDKIEEQVSLLLQEKAKREKIALPTSDGLIFIKIVDIIRCESDSSYTMFYLSNNRKLLVTRTMKEFAELLPANMFFRIHKSHLINLNHIDQYINRDGGSVIMDNGNHVPIARNRKDGFVKALGN